MIQKKSSFKICTISLAFMLLIVLFSVVFVSSLGTTLLCLGKGQTAKFSLCNPSMDDKLCSCTSKTCTCQLCVNEISPGVYCPASPNACNVGSLECTYLPIDNSTNNSNQTNNTNPSLTVNLTTPSDNQINYTSNAISLPFFYGVSNSSIVKSCSLYINDIKKVTNSSKITALMNNKLSTTLAPSNYNWFIRCITKDGSSYDSVHRSLSITDTNPKTNNSINITLTNPENNYLVNTTNTAEILFVYTVSDKTNITMCNLNVNGDILISSTISSLENNFSANLSVGNYTWNIDCVDKSAKSYVSETRTLIVQNSSQDTTPINPPVTTGSSGGGGGGSISGGTVNSCNTKYNCTEWSLCINKTQSRVCNYNTTKCKPTGAKPIELESCTEEQTQENNESITNKTTTQPNTFNNLLTGASVALKNKPLTIGVSIIVIIICIILIFVIKATSKRKNKDKTKTNEKEEDKTENKSDKEKEVKKETKKEKKENKEDKK
jgi:hypothetical protein